MRTLLLATALLAGCSLIKFNVSTAETRRQESEALARQAAAIKQQEQDQARAAAVAAEQTRLAEQAATTRARDEQLERDIAAARADLAAGFTPAKALAFHTAVAAAESSALARDGRLDMPALWREVVDALARAAVDPPAHAVFLVLTAVARSPERDAAVVRACPKVRPAIARDDVVEFVAACLAAADDERRRLDWPGVKADLAAYNKAEDARRKADAEAAEAARVRARTLAFAVVPLFAGGRCDASDCTTSGWTAAVEAGTLAARCSFGKCLADGWTTRMPDGSEARTTCNFGDCNKNGWDTDLGNLRLRTRCHFSDCGKNGWTLELPDGARAETRCSGSDCWRDGWDTGFPDGRTVRCRCEFGDCRKRGATCQ